MGKHNSEMIFQKVSLLCEEPRAEAIRAHCAMTSTVVLEIIDLTDTRTSSDNESQKIPTAEDCDPDPEKRKRATRAPRKRKNGEARMARSFPVKSRDGSLEHDHAQSGEGTEPQRAEDAQGSNGEPKGKKKRRSKKNKDKDNKDSVPSSRDDTQHDALLTFDNGELFLVDTVPAVVPEGIAFDSARDAKAPPSSSQTSVPDRVPLLLPAHVSVLDPGDDLPVQTIQPPESDSDSESYIEYLDYDDRLVRSQHPLLP
jgi:protein AIR1/2